MELKVKDGTYVFDVPYKDGELDEFQVRYCRPEARDFRYHFHVTDNLGERSIPSDHVAILCCHTETIGSWRRWQADPELEVETSRLLHLFEADS